LELFAGHLAVLPLFRGLTPLQIAAMARHAERMSYTPGSTIIEENEIADAAILIVSGTAVRVSGPEVGSRAEPVAAGSLLGEAAMLVETTYGSTIVARTAVRAVHITRSALHEQMLADPDLAGRIAENLGKRLSKVADVLRQVDECLATASSSTLSELAASSQVESDPPALRAAS
jgi:CRP-like cAMP-binding protein